MSISLHYIFVLDLFIFLSLSPELSVEKCMFEVLETVSLLQRALAGLFLCCKLIEVCTHLEPHCKFLAVIMFLWMG